MPSTFNKIPRPVELPTSSSSATAGPGESENDLEAILFSLLGSEKGRQKMNELQAKDKRFAEVVEGSPVATTVPSESDEPPTVPQASCRMEAASPEEAYVLESAQAKSAWSSHGVPGVPPGVPGIPGVPPASQRTPPPALPPPPPIAPLATEPPYPRSPVLQLPSVPGLDCFDRSHHGTTGLMYAPWAKVCESASPMTTQQLQAQSQLQAQRVLGIRSEKSKAASWTLAWCADFNRVNIHSSLKDHLHEMVMSKGGVVVPFWSARGLSKWLQSNGNVPYVMLADLSVLDMSIRSTTLHHRKEKTTKKPVHIFVASYDDNVEEVKSIPPVVQSVQTSVVSFSEFGFRDMASEAVLMVLGLS